jgi:chromosome condensin MukBEF ATPase and DNA-binding subunit MukB
MTGYYSLLNVLKTHFDNDVLVNSVTQGSIFNVDLAKQTLFPLVHIMVNQATLEDNTIRLNVTLLAMDNVDQRKEVSNTKFENADNEIDVLNTQLAILNRCYQQLKHGTLYDQLYHVEDNPTCEPFVERFENYLAGWAMTFDVVIPNEMTIC